MNQRQLLDQLEDPLKCAICFNLLQRPKSLPCLHSFCRTCLQDFIDGCDYDYECPCCRRAFSPKPAREFPDDFSKAGQVQALRSHAKNTNSTKRCEICLASGEESYDSSATGTCLDCGFPLCSSHIEIHSERFPKHKVAKHKAKLEGAGLCDEHKGYELMYLCVQCKVHVCQICTFQYHMDKQYHSLKEIDEINMTDEEITTLRDALVEKQEKYEKFRSTVDTIRESVDEDSQIVQDAIDKLTKFQDEISDFSNNLEDTMKSIFNIVDESDDEDCIPDLVDSLNSHLNSHVKGRKNVLSLLKTIQNASRIIDIPIAALDVTKVQVDIGAVVQDDMSYQKQHFIIEDNDANADNDDEDNEDKENSDNEDAVFIGEYELE